MPLGRPLYEPTPLTRLSGHNRDIQALKSRSADRWIYWGTYPGDPQTTSDSLPFQNDWVNNGDGTSDEDQLSRFRLLLGGGLEFHLNVIGGDEGTIITSFPAGYWDGAKQTVPADNNGTYFPITIVPRDDGSGIADIYAGRV